MDAKNYSTLIGRL